MNLLKIIKNGIITENPTFVQIVGICPILAVTTSVINGIGMGLATTVVLMCSNVVISLVRKSIPGEIRIPSYILIVAGFTTVVQFLMHAYAPASLNNSLGIFIPLIAVNCLILARAESFASKNGPLASAVDGLGMGLGFTVSLAALGVIREIMGNGSIFDIPILPHDFPHMLIMIMAPGAFFALAALMMLIKYYSRKKGGTN